MTELKAVLHASLKTQREVLRQKLSGLTEAERWADYVANLTRIAESRR